MINRIRYSNIILFSFFFMLISCQEKIRVLKTDLLVVGGGASGTTAGIQASSMGINTIITEETNWLGGMLTAAGVSAIDGDHNLPSGLWGEFRKRLYEYYGGEDSVATGWVSNTLFEPHVGAQILLDMAKKQKRLTLLFHTRFLKVIKKGNEVTGAYFLDLDDHSKIMIKARLTIDATELGDVLANAGCDYDVGLDYNELNGQRYSKEIAQRSIQDLTYVAILKDFGPNADKTIEKPANYDPANYQCCCKEACASDSLKPIECAKMLTYGKLPNNKYMINWPNHGNDYNVNIIELSPSERQKALKPAKDFTLGFVYFIQTALGYKNLGLADDEYNTSDRLPYIPYHRESRRLSGVVKFTVNDIMSPYDNPQKRLYKTAIAVGDYPIDHHHDKTSNKPKIKFPPVPSFGLPIGCMIPEKTDGLIVAEKSISVSHIANGATRLQPVVMLLGQAAGTLAAECIKKAYPPRKCNIRSVQKYLLDAGCWLLPFIDITPSDVHFKILQEAGASGILKGTGIPYKWANQTRIYPDSLLTAEAFQYAINQITDKPVDLSDLGIVKKNISVSTFIGVIRDLTAEQHLVLAKSDETNPNDLEFVIQRSWEKWQLPSEFSQKRFLTRREFAVIMHHLYAPFSMPINFNGQLDFGFLLDKFTFIEAALKKSLKY